MMGTTKVYASHLYFTLAVLSLLLVPHLANSSAAAEFTVQSTTHCCFSSALQIPINHGTAEFMYTGGAWTNGYNRLNWFGYLELVIPELGINETLGTNEQTAFSSYDLAVQAALGDILTIDNDTGGPVTAYLYVADGCPNFWCGDNWGTVSVELSYPTVDQAVRSFGALKAQFK